MKPGVAKSLTRSVGGRMDTLQCAVVLAKLERFNWEIEQRVKIGQRYTDLISPSQGPKEGVQIQPVTICPDRTSVYAQYTLICIDREAIQAKLKQANIPTAIHYPVPLNEQTAYKHLCCPDCTPVAQQIAKQVLSLPMGPDLSKAQQQHIVQHLL